MIGNTVEYLQANNLILKIMRMIENNPVFDDLKPIQASDIVNLSLDILRILIQIHDDSSDGKQRDINLMEEISESYNCFIRFADISIDCQRSNNQDLMDLLKVFGDIDDKDDFISRMLIYQRESSCQKTIEGGK